MKLLPILAALLLSGTVASAQTVTATTTTKKQPASANASARAKVATAKPKPAQAAAGAIKWDKTAHQFGEIKQGTPVTATFKYTNTGKKPLLLTNAQGSCGCTVPNWSKEPLLPGKSQVITATFNAAAAGPFNKTVTVTTNADTTGPQVLTLTGTVLAGATAEAPKK